MRLQHCGVAREYSSPPPVCSFASVQSAANILWILSSGELLSTMFKTILSSVFLMAFFFFNIKLISKIWTDYSHTSYLSRKPREFSCKFFLASVNFYRFNAKNWQFTVYFAVITQKIGNLLCILS